MRLGLLPGTLSPSGGPGTYVTGLVEGLLEQPGVQVQALLLGLRHFTEQGRRQRRQVSALLGDDLQVRTRAVSGRLYGTALRPLLPSYDLLFRRHDIYHQTHLDLDPAVPGGRLVLTLHDLVAERWPDEGRLLPNAERLLSRAAAVVTVSEASRCSILKRFSSLDPDRIHVIWNGLAHEVFHPRGLDDDGRRLDLASVTAPYLLYVGGLSRRKNVSTLIAAHAAARHKDPTTPVLVLVGPWQPADLGDQRVEGVMALGAVEKATVAALMRRALAVVLPSRDEGFGLPVLEAQACGTAVICSDIPAFQEVGGPAPHYVDTRSVDTLTAGLLRVLRTAGEEGDGRRQAGVAHATTFSWQRSAAQHRAVYEAVHKAATR